MTDTEIKKAFEYCTFAEDCADCPLFKNCPSSFGISQMALDLINRLEEENSNYSRNNRSLTKAVTEMQKALKKRSAEIERLQKETNQFADIGKMYSEIKAEAIKEFAERLKGTCYTYSDICGYQSTVIDINEIDNLVKEMVGDAE